MGNDKIVSLGSDFRSWPRRYWGSRDREMAAASRRLSEIAPLGAPPPTVSWGPMMSSEADRRRRELSRLEEKFGLKPKPWV